MFKKLLQLKTLLVALLVMTGAGNAWADEELYYTLTPAKGSNNSYTENCDVTIDGITWNIGGNSQQLPWRIGGKSITKKDRAVYSKTAMESAISKVELEVGAASSITVNSLKLIVASDANFNTKIDEVTATFTENSTITFTPSSPGVEWATDAYYKFVFNVTVSGNSNKFVEFNSAKFYHQDDSTPVPTHTATFSVNGATTTQDFNEGATIIFPEKPADINDKTFVGWVTDAIEGTTDTAPSFVTSATMGSSDVTYYAVFAKREGGVNSVTDELDGAFTGVTGTSYTNWSDKTDNSAAVYAGNSAGGNSYIQLRSNNNNSGIVTTTSGGTLTKVAVTWNSNTIAGRTLNVYGSNTAYEAAADLYDSSKQDTLLGSIVKGTSTELSVSGDYAYVGLRSDNGAMYLDQVDITWSVSSYTYSDYCTSVIETPKTATTLTIDATGLTNTDVYVSTAAGSLAATVLDESNEPVAGATVQWTSSDNDVATIAADGTVTLVAAGTTTFTATYAGDDTYAGSYNTYEMTVTSSEPAPTFVKVTDVSALAVGDKITFVNEENSYALGAFKSNNYGAVSVTISENTFKSNEVEILTLEEGQGEYAPEGKSVWAFKKDNGKYLNAPGGTNKNYMKESSDLNAESSAVIWVENGNAAVRFINFSLDDAQGRVIVRYNPNNGSPMFSCYAIGQEDIQIYKIVTDATVSVSAAGYATFSSTTALDFTNVGDINAYTATVRGNDISFKRVKKVRANTGLLLRSVNVDGGAVSTSVPSLTDAADDVTGNAFVAATTDILSLATTDGKYTNYILNKPSDGIIGFYKANGQKVGAGKAYLRVSSSSKLDTRAFIAFSFDDPETGIAQVETLPQQGVAYDLQGRRVNAPKGGLYIINGKKVIVK